MTRPLTHGGSVTSPYIALDAPDSLGRKITITFAFDDVTRLLATGTVHRDANCRWHKIVVGIGVDGQPDSSTHTFNVGNLVGDQVFTAVQMAAVGFSTIEDVLALQITAIP